MEYTELMRRRRHAQERAAAAAAELAEVEAQMADARPIDVSTGDTETNWRVRLVPLEDGADVRWARTSLQDVTVRDIRSMFMTRLSPGAWWLGCHLGDLPGRPLRVAFQLQVRTKPLRLDVVATEHPPVPYA